MSTIPMQFELQTSLFRNAIDGIDDNAASKRHSEHANHLKFIAGHLVYTRLMMKDFGGYAADPRFDQFKEKMDPSASYLPMKDISAKWEEISGPLTAGLKAIPAAALAADAPFPTPGGNTVEGLLGFFAHHEAYHIGQLGILRKFAGKEAMTYK